MKLVYATIWLLVAAVFFFAPLDQSRIPFNLTLGGCAALALAAYNLVRWILSYSLQRPKDESWRKKPPQPPEENPFKDE